MVTPALLRERFAATALPEDPTDIVFPEGAESWPENLRQDLSAGLSPAGVLIPLIQRSSGLTVLLTQRSAELKHHAGQISFPGGRMEADDRDIAHTALRETWEEVGIEPAQVTIIGYLPPMPTITGYAVTPSIGLVEEQHRLVLDSNEVESTFEVPLAFLMDGSNMQQSEREYQGQRFPVVEFRFEDYRIWGATAQMILKMKNHINNNS